MDGREGERERERKCYPLQHVFYIHNFHIVCHRWARQLLLTNDKHRWDEAEGGATLPSRPPSSAGRKIGHLWKGGEEKSRFILFNWADCFVSHLPVATLSSSPILPILPILPIGLNPLKKI